MSILVSFVVSIGDAESVMDFLGLFFLLLVSEDDEEETTTLMLKLFAVLIYFTEEFWTLVVVIVLLAEMHFFQLRLSGIMQSDIIRYSLWDIPNGNSERQMTKKAFNYFVVSDFMNQFSLV